MIYSEKLNFSWLFWASCLTLLLFSVGTGGASAVAIDVRFSKFEAHDEQSTVLLDYSAWDTVLRSTVFMAGPSSRKIRRSRSTPTGTRISLANPNRSWLEGNRVNFHLLNDEHIAAVIEFRGELEALPDRIGGLGALSRDAQLAYWLNLYNVTVYGLVAERYPIIRLKSFRKGRWDEKLLTVSGVPLSLNDIQNEILIPIWKTPLVLYGLYQGSVGGPNIRGKAYHPNTVWDKLRSNAKEFVNSIRAVHKKRNYARASRIYEWGAAAFPGGMADLRSHLLEYADDETRAILEDSDQLRIGYYDWYIADIYNGRPNWVSIHANIVTKIDGQTSSLEAGAPPHVREYFDTMRLKFRILDYTRGRVYMEEVTKDKAEKDSGEKDSPDKPKINKPKR